MDPISENINDKWQQADSKNKEICPDLILADVIVCAALDRFYQPSKRQITECCANEDHVRCSLRRSV